MTNFPSFQKSDQILLLSGKVELSRAGKTLTETEDQKKNGIYNV